MQFTSAILALIASAAMTNAAVVQIFSDDNCQTLIAERNVFDNTCAPTGGFSSFKVTGSGAGGQQVTAYSRNACVAPTTGCTPATISNCIKATNGDGASNALSSSPNCGTV